MNPPLSRNISIMNAQFTPISSSPLHITMPTVGVLIPRLLAPTPPPIHMDALETISTYTADGDGDEVEIEDVTDMLVRYEHPTCSF